MTTKTSHGPTRHPVAQWDRTLMCLQWGLSTITAEYHPHDHHGSMKYSLHIHGGRGNGVVIHCPTEPSVINLFKEIVALHKMGICHPFLYDV